LEKRIKLRSCLSWPFHAKKSYGQTR